MRANRILFKIKEIFDKSKEKYKKVWKMILTM